jgi:phage-related protein (TIGR01555 family)
MSNEQIQDGYTNLAFRLGIGSDNVSKNSQYLFDLLTRNRLALESMYRGSWIVGAAVDSVAEDMTRSGIVIKGSDTPEDIERLQSEMTRKGIWNSLLDAIKWSRLYGGALAVIVIDGQDMSTPLDASTVAKDQFVGLKVYDRWQLQPSVSNLIYGGKYDGLPKYYNVISDVNTGAVSALRIHYSRVIRLIGIQLPVYQALTEQFWGESIIERLHDRLIAFDSATMSAMNLMQKAHLRTVKIEKLREILSAGGKANENLLNMFHTMRQLQSNEGITLLDKEDEFAAHSYSFAGLNDVILQFGQQISGALGIPLVRLFGQSPAGLNSTGESDLRTYYDNIMSQQESRLRDGLDRVLKVLHASTFGRPAPDNIDFDFTPLWQTSTREKSEIAARIAETIAKVYEAGIIDHATALTELRASSDSTHVFTNITQEAIDSATTPEPPEPAVAAPDPGLGQNSQNGKVTDSKHNRILEWIKRD